MGATRLLSDLVSGDVWDYDPETRCVYVTMLALADHTGYVKATKGGITAFARLNRDAVDRAIGILSKPDSDNARGGSDGSRIQEAEGGWLVRDYYEITAADSTDPYAVQARIRMRKYRLRNADATDDGVEPATDGALDDKNGGEEAESLALTMQRVLGPLFGKAQGEKWRYLEEQQCFMVSQQSVPTKTELDTLVDWLNNYPDRQYLPQSLLSLFERWDHNIGRSQKWRREQKNRLVAERRTPMSVWEIKERLSACQEERTKLVEKHDLNHPSGQQAHPAEWQRAQELTKRIKALKQKMTE